MVSIVKKIIEQEKNNTNLLKTIEKQHPQKQPKKFYTKQYKPIQLNRKLIHIKLIKDFLFNEKNLIEKQ